MPPTQLWSLDSHERSSYATERRWRAVDVLSRAIIDHHGRQEAPKVGMERPVTSLFLPFLYLPEHLESHPEG